MKVVFVKDGGGNIDLLSVDTHRYVTSLLWSDLSLTDRKILCNESVLSENKKEIIENQIVLLQKKIDILKSIEF